MAAGDLLIPSAICPKNNGVFRTTRCPQKWTAATTDDMKALGFVAVGDTVYLEDGSLKTWLVVPVNSLTPSGTAINGTVVTSVQFIRDWAGSGGSGSVVTGLAAIKALTGSVGQIIHETSRGFSWKAFAYGSIVDEDVTVVNATDNSVTWYLIPDTTDTAKWLAQADWYVDGTSGSDWDTGASGHPLESIDEVQRRRGSDTPGSVATTIHVLNDCSGGILQTVKNQNEDIFTVIGEPTLLYSGTIDTITTVDAVNNRWVQITAVGLSNWVSYVDKRIRFTSGTYAGYVAFITAASPDGRGATYAEISFPVGPPSIANSYYSPPNIPSAGDQFAIESLPVVDNLSVTVNGISHDNMLAPNNSESFPVLLVRDIDFGKLHVGSAGSGSYGSHVFGCNIDVLSSSTYYTALNEIEVSGCLLHSLQYVFPSSQYKCCAWMVDAGSQNYILPGIFSFLFYCLFRGVTVYTDQLFGINTLGIFDAPYDCITLHYTVCDIYGPFVGFANNGVGVCFDTFAQFKFDAEGSLKITGSLGDFRFYNASDGTSYSVHSWSEIPIRFNGGDGEATLVAGTTSVPIADLPADAVVQKGRKTLVGDFGELTHTQSTSGIVLNSTTDTDDSVLTYSWRSPSRPNGAVWRVVS